MTIDIKSIRGDFPILAREDNGLPLTYLDSAATSLKPRPVIEAVQSFYEQCTANVHRAVHQLSEEATERLEASRETIARFINADTREIAFVRNSTEGLNLIANALTENDHVVSPLSEHHSNLLPWGRFKQTILDIGEDGNIDMASTREWIRAESPTVVSASTVSNAFGVHLPIDELRAEASNAGADFVLDLSQSAGHSPVDVYKLGCDFAVLSGHKMLGPSGIGILYKSEQTKRQLLPLYLGGEMVHEVHRDHYVARPFPWCMEAGTPNIEGTFGLAAACNYLDDIGLDSISEHCSQLCTYLRDELEDINGVRLITPRQAHYPGIIVFQVEGQTAHGIARVLSNRFNIMVRSGFHCAQPAHEALGLEETLRASVHIYNSRDDIEKLVDAVKTIVKTL
jgi:cysteine desulfurase/selenocysteine lyase